MKIGKNADAECAKHFFEHRPGGNWATDIAPCRWLLETMEGRRLRIAL